MKRLGTYIISLLVLLTSAQFAYADSSCTPIYGGGQTCVQTGNISINKTVQNPQTGVFVDNLGINDPKFAPGQTINFQIAVTDTGGQLLNQVFVTDTFPQFVTSVSGPGSFNTSTNTQSFEVDNLQPNETRTFNLSAQAVAENQLSSDTNCVVNQSSATANGQTSQDNAQFCIQKSAQPVTTTTPATTTTTMVNGQPVTTVVNQPTETKGGLKVFPAPQTVTTPPTGPEALPLLGMLPTGLLGYFLRKKSK